jgi:uncharacterized protein YndB with AHSA1/START domain
MERTGMENSLDKLSIERSIWIASSRDRVWRAITDTHQFTQWFSPGLPWELTALEEGGKLIWHSSNEGSDLHIIEKVDPPHQYVIRWQPEPPEKPLVTTYTLTEENGGTRVTVTESGYENLPEDVRQKRAESSAKGYAEMLAELKAFIEPLKVGRVLGVERSVWVKVAPERAWQAVTEPEQLNQWYATYYHWRISALEVGAAVKFYNKDDESDAQNAVIAVVDPPREFTVNWQEAPKLITSFLLAAEEDGTRVTIREMGYENVPEAERQSWLDATAEGYSMSVENLKAFLEGRSIPF